MRIASTVRNVLRRGKDTGASLIILRLMQKNLAKYGKIETFSIDSRLKSISCELRLNGETEPLKLVIHEYELDQTAGEMFLIIKRAETSKPWLNALLEDFVISRRFPVPEKYATQLRMVL